MIIDYICSQGAANLGRLLTGLSLSGLFLLGVYMVFKNDH